MNLIARHIKRIYVKSRKTATFQQNKSTFSVSSSRGGSIVVKLKGGRGLYCSTMQGSWSAPSGKFLKFMISETVSGGFRHKHNYKKPPPLI